jgi:hypothetical protein
MAYVVFGLRESFNLIVTVLNLPSIAGILSGLGETIRSSFRLLSNCTYSLNVSTILFPLKFIVESFGTALTKTGGKESLGPPVGGIILAQPELIKPVIKLIKPIANTNELKIFFIKSCANIDALRC